MKENIKILEELKDILNDNMPEAGDSYLMNNIRELRIKEIQAIENLIKRNKELEEELMQKDLEIIGTEEYTKASMKEIIEHYYTANEDCISKSVIKEKIEEYLEFDKKSKTYTKDGRENFTIEYFKAKTLEELLEDK
jgi:hypothetical protein